MKHIQRSYNECENGENEQDGKLQSKHLPFRFNSTNERTALPQIIHVGQNRGSFWLVKNINIKTSSNT